MKKQSKTIRASVWESNSSSSSAFTVNVPKKGSLPQFKPYFTEDTTILYDSHDGVGSWANRIQFLTGFLSMTGRVDEIPTFMETISEFAGVKITMTGIKDEKPEDGCDLRDWCADEYWSFCNEYGHDGFDDFKKCMDAILADKELIIPFVFSEGWVSEESWYNG